MNYDTPLIRSLILFLAVIIAAAIFASMPNGVFIIPVQYAVITTYLLLGFIAGVAVLTAYTAIAARQATETSRVKTNVIEAYAGSILLTAASTALLITVHTSWSTQAVFTSFTAVTVITTTLTLPRFHDRLNRL